MNKHFEPSAWNLEQQIAAAMAKFDASRARFLTDRAEAAFAHNKKVAAASREHDVRRRVNAGDRR